VLLFTSPGDGHGKTTTLARLLPHVARSFSGSVLVVDANTRNPELARRLEVAATWRLTDVLAGATHWMNAVRPTALPRVSLLPGGTDTSRRPIAHAAADLLRELAGHYDLVLVDATSLAHDGAAQLAAACDGTCLIVRLGEGNRRTVRDAVRVVNRAGGRLLGCIAIDAGA
jgi:receptor protein-tyrosine kinase